MYRNERTQFHTFLAKMRQGKNVTLERLAQGLCSVSMLDRIETGERLPGKMLRDRLLARLGIASDEYEELLWTDEYRSWKKRQKLLKAVADKDMKTAEEIIRQFERQNTKKNEIERQFYLVMRAQIMQYQGAGQAELRDVFGRALDCTLTGRGVDQWKGGLLSEQEWNILLEYICFGGNVGQVIRKDGETYQAAAYGIVLSVIQESDIDSYCCVKIYSKAAYYLCLEWVKECRSINYGKILQVCGSAVEMLRSTKRMFYLCELLEIMEDVWEEMRREGGEEKTVCTRNIALSQIRAWRKELIGLYQSSGVSAKMENCTYLYRQTRNRLIGDTVRRRREMLGMSVNELCEGICHEKTLRRLESGTIKTQKEIAGELLGRLGMSTDIRIYKLLMNSVAGCQGRIGANDSSSKISDEIIKEDLTLRRMTVLHENIYHKLQNRMECPTGILNAEGRDFLNRELEKCIQFAELCQDTIYEKFYREKQRELFDNSVPCSCESIVLK